MQAVVQFSKTGSARYVSHLDTLRMMQRAFRRAGWPLAYSQGYHPHPQMSFALALPVGAEAQADLMQVELTGEPDLNMLKDKLAAAMPPGFAVSGLCPMQDKAVLTTMVTACDWIFSFPADCEGEVRTFASFLEASESLPAVKQSGKKPGKIVDVRPGMTIGPVTTENGICRLPMRLRASQEDYVQPALVMSLAPESLQQSVWQLRRGTMYTTRDGEICPLIKIFEVTVS